jgi:hypothetical protein
VLLSGAASGADFFHGEAIRFVGRKRASGTRLVERLHSQRDRGRVLVHSRVGFVAVDSHAASVLGRLRSGPGERRAILVLFSTQNASF